MNNWHNDFAIDPAQIWLNVASEGPLPIIAKEALQEAIQWKMSPHLLSIPKFQQIPLELKQSIAKLINVYPEDIILGNSATYGIHLLANGLPLKAGDEIILMQNDFPTDILPWLSLTDKGVKALQLKPAHHVLTVEEIKAAITPRTKVLCLSYIHSFSGWPIDVRAIGNLAREYGILFVLNLSQAAGAFSINLRDLPVDAVVCAGYKWLLGPYGTGFCWMKKEVRETLNYPQNYWISLMDEASLSGEGVLTLKNTHVARRYDVFGTANFFNYVPWRASIDYLMSIGVDKIYEHNQLLVQQLIEGLKENNFNIISPQGCSLESNIVVFSHTDASRNAAIAEHLKSKGIHLAYWKGKLRASPHLYNQSTNIKDLIKALYETNHQ